jgi:hypothetical protein
MDPFTLITGVIGLGTTLYSLISGAQNQADSEEIQKLSIEDLLENQLPAQISEAEYMGGGTWNPETGEYEVPYEGLEGFKDYLDSVGEDDLGYYELEAKGMLEDIELMKTGALTEQDEIKKQLKRVQGAARVAAASGGIKSTSASVQALQKQSTEDAQTDIDNVWLNLGFEKQNGKWVYTGSLTEDIEQALGTGEVWREKAESLKGQKDTYQDIYDYLFPEKEETEPTTTPSPSPDPDVDNDADDAGDAGDAGDPFTGPYDMGP